MPSIEFGYQQSNVPDIEMVPGLLDNEYFCDNDLFQSFGNNDLFQSFSDKLGIPLKPEETVEKSVKDTLSLSTFKELGLNFAQNNSEYLFEETSEIKNEVKSEPQSPNAQDFMSSANLISTSYSESSDSDGQITNSMQDVSDSMENFTLETSLVSPLQYTLSSPQSSQASSDISNAAQQFNITQKNISINQQDIKDTDITYNAKANNTEHLVWSHITNDGKANTINFATVVGYTAKLKQTSSSTCQVLPGNESINVQNSPSIKSIGTKTGTTSFQLPQNMKIINTVSNIRAANNTESIDTSSILNNDSMVCNIVTSEPINTSFQLMQNKKSPSPLILTDDLINLPTKIVNDQECKLKALKRQQRMIKNRESACLSRKKRKEYVSSLERQVFELKEENKQLKSENDILKQRLTEMGNSIIYENNKSNLSLESLAKTKAKKKIAFALCIAIMISFNVNNFRETFSQNVHFKAKPDNLPITMPEIIHTRRLLWTVDENNNMDQIDENFNKSIPIHPVCPMYINQSESIRLDSELRRWIDGESDKDNRTTSKGTKLETDPLKIVLSRSSLAERPKKRLYLSRDRKIKTMHKMIDVRPADHYSINNNAVEVFSPILSEYASLFEALGRKDDTFYVVWFSGEHLLLPASRKNNTARPKMSLVLPAVSINGTFPTPPNHITMMQIDCEVTNTQLLHLQRSIIPVHLRNSKTTNQSSRSHSVEDMIDPYVANLTRNYKPYFMKEANRKQRYKKDIA